jgi:polysaccharide chain length determinant protein (PEP-CTERM system associated)
MQELLKQFLEQARGLWRFRLPALAVAWVVCLVGWVVVLLLPPVYQANARVYVDTTAVLRPLLQGIAVEQDIAAQLGFVRQALLSRPNLEKVARETDLDLQANTAKDKEMLIDSIRDRVEINMVGESAPRPGQGRLQTANSLYEISFEDSRRQKALGVVQAIVSAFVEDTLGGKRSGADAAQKFLTEQVADYEKRLAASEQQLAAFKRRNVGLVPGAQGDYFTRLQSETQALEKAQADLSVTLQRRDELQRQLRGEQPYIASTITLGRPTTPGAAAAAGGDLSLRIQETERALDAMLLRYTDKHPEVIATRQVLAELKVRQQAEIEALQRGQASAETLAGLSANPIYQQVQGQLNEVNVELAALRSQLSLHQQQVIRLRGMLDTAPEVEAEYARLIRDYDVTKAQYNELVTRLDRARISEEAEQTGVIRFEIIDPPNASVQPVAPDRPRLIALVLAVGLAAGAGVAFVMHQLKPVFPNATILAEITGLPVIGAVSRTWRERHRVQRRQEMLKAALSAGCLLLVFAAILFSADRAVRILQGLLA